MEENNDFFEEPTNMGEEISQEETKLARGGAPRQKIKKAKILNILLAVGIGASCFCVGFFARHWSLDKEMRTLVKVKDKIQDEYYEDVSDEQFYDALYAGINHYLLDSYSVYMTEEEYDAMRVQATGKQSGMGIYFLSGTTDLTVYRVAGTSPAEETGRQKGDTITAVGKTEDSLQACTQRKDFSDFLSTVVDGEIFYLQWRNEKNELKCAPSKKETYVENYVFYKTNEKSYGFESEGIHKIKMVGEPLTVLDDDTAYIKITQFNGTADSVFDKAMAVFRLQEKKDLIIDLRGNGGGYMDVMQSIAKYFCKSSKENKPIAAIADYGERKQSFHAEGNTYYEFFAEDSRITVLADNMTASASECLIGCMYAYDVLDYEDICLVEEEDGVAKTYGKGIMQTTYDISGGGALKLTTAKIFWPTPVPYSIHGEGITKTHGTKTVSATLSYEEQTLAAIQALYA